MVSDERNMPDSNDDVYLFLDIDGVICPKNRPVTDIEAQDWGQGWGKVFDPQCLNSFESEVIKHDQLNIVISSNWRKKQSLEKMRQAFSPQMAEKIVGVTPELNPTTRHYRYNEVLLYFKRNKLGSQHWIAIDDDEEHYPNSTVMVVTDTLKGFDELSANQLNALIQNFAGK